MAWMLSWRTSVLGAPPVICFSSMSPSGPGISRAAYPSDRRRRHEGGADHVALDGLVRRVAGEERQRGVGRGVDDVHVSRGHDLVAGDLVREGAVVHLEDDLVA